MKTLLRHATLLVAILGSMGGVALAQQPITVPLALVDIGGNSGSPDYKLGIWLDSAEVLRSSTNSTRVEKGCGLPTKRLRTSMPESISGGDHSKTWAMTSATCIRAGTPTMPKMVTSSVQIYGNVYSPGSGNSPGTLATQSSGSLDIAQIDSAHKEGEPSSGSEWKASVKAGQPALQTQFFGDFGVSLEVKADGSKESILRASAIDPERPDQWLHRQCWSEGKHGASGTAWARRVGSRFVSDSVRHQCGLRRAV